MNLQVIRTSRAAPEAGDVFRMRLTDGMYLFGRVIHTAVKFATGLDAILVHVYQPRNTSGEPPLADMTIDRLLIRPELVNKLPWSRGYFETVAQGPLPSSARPSHLCFYSQTFGIYKDESGREIASRSEPCGLWALGNHATVDQAISRALELSPLPSEARDQPREGITLSVGLAEDPLFFGPGEDSFVDVGDLEDAIARGIEPYSGAVTGHEISAGGARLTVFMDGRDERIRAAVRKVIEAKRGPETRYELV